MSVQKRQPFRGIMKTSKKVKVNLIKNCQKEKSKWISQQLSLKSHPGYICLNVF